MARTCDECGTPSTTDSYGIQQTLVLGTIACRCGVNVAIVPVKAEDRLDLCAECARSVMIATIFGPRFFERASVTVARLIDELDMSLWDDLPVEERKVAFARSILTCFEDIPSEMPQPGADVTFDALCAMIDGEDPAAPPSPPEPEAEIAPAQGATGAPRPEMGAACEPDAEGERAADKAGGSPAEPGAVDVGAVDVPGESDGKQEDAEAGQAAAGDDNRRPEAEEAPEAPSDE